MHLKAETLPVRGEWLKRGFYNEKDVSASRMLFENGGLYRRPPSPSSSLHAGGVSRSAERDLGLRPKNLQAFKKA